MSTQLGNLQVKIEIPNRKKQTSDYIDTDVLLNRFYGGTKRGTSLQITFENETGDTSHIQLDNKNVHQLIKTLTEGFI